MYTTQEFYDRLRAPFPTSSITIKPGRIIARDQKLFAQARPCLHWRGHERRPGRRAGSLTRDRFRRRGEAVQGPFLRHVAPLAGDAPRYEANGLAG
jgi:hypothetical protein